MAYPLFCMISAEQKLHLSTTSVEKIITAYHSDAIIIKEQFYLCTPPSTRITQILWHLNHCKVFNACFSCEQGYIAIIAKNRRQLFVFNAFDLNILTRVIETRDPIADCCFLQDDKHLVVSFTNKVSLHVFDVTTEARPVYLYIPQPAFKLKFYDKSIMCLTANANIFILPNINLDFLPYQHMQTIKYQYLHKNLRPELNATDASYLIYYNNDTPTAFLACTIDGNKILICDYKNLQKWELIEVKALTCIDTIMFEEERKYNRVFFTCHDLKLKKSVTIIVNCIHPPLVLFLSTPITKIGSPLSLYLNVPKQFTRETYKVSTYSPDKTKISLKPFAGFKSLASLCDRLNQVADAEQLISKLCFYHKCDADDITDFKILELSSTKHNLIIQISYCCSAEPTPAKPTTTDEEYTASFSLIKDTLTNLSLIIDSVEILEQQSN